MPKGDETLYAFRVETKTALVLGGGGITGGLRECFARYGMEVSLERLAADRFLQQAAVPASRRRFGLKRQQPAVPAR